MDVYENLKANALRLPAPPKPGGAYVKVQRTGNLLYLSGQGPFIDGETVFQGRLGEEISIPEGQQAAKNCALNLLSCLDEYLGDLNKVKKVVKILAFVAGSPGFGQQPQVINAASEVFTKAFGENGAHARSAIGTSDLPGNIPVEIEAIFEI